MQRRAEHAERAYMLRLAKEGRSGPQDELSPAGRTSRALVLGGSSRLPSSVTDCRAI